MKTQQWQQKYKISSIDQHQLYLSVLKVRAADQIIGFSYCYDYLGPKRAAVMKKMSKEEEMSLEELDLACANLNAMALSDLRKFPAQPNVKNRHLQAFANHIPRLLVSSTKEEAIDSIACDIINHPMADVTTVISCIQSVREVTVDLRTAAKQKGLSEEAIENARLVAGL